MVESEILIRLRAVGFRFDGHVALEGVDLELRRGDRLAVLGPNGGGKTTLLTILLGLRRAGSGRTEGPVADGRVRTGYVPQFPAFDRSFPIRVEEVILEGRLRERGRGRGFRAEDRAAAAAAMRQLDLEGLSGAYLTELSGGELKRALIARALTARPELLVLDEPAASLDKTSRRQFWELISALPEATTIVLATHDLAPSTFAPSRAMFVDRGVRELSLDDWRSHDFLCGHGHD